LWLSPDPEVVTYPPIPNELTENHANLLFSGVTQGVRAPNLEIPGGHIAPIATNNNRVQTPPNSLDRMHACIQKQVAFNQRILKKEEMISSINVEMPDFMMGVVVEVSIVACVNFGERMRGTQPVCGVLLVQEDRRMTQSCSAMDGLGNSREEVALSGIIGVLKWRHALETSFDQDYKRPCQSLVIYPKLLDKLDAVITTGDIRHETEPGRCPAYEEI
jgi:hypothetical protein